MSDNKGCGCLLMVLVILGFIAAVAIYSKTGNLNFLELFK